MEMVIIINYKHQFMLISVNFHNRFDKALTEIFQVRRALLKCNIFGQKRKFKFSFLTAANPTPLKIATEFCNTHKK
jgi:hypothetical protein